MNKKFDLKRFADYLVYDLKNARVNYGLTLMILSCFPVIFYALWILFNNLWGDHWTSPIFGIRIGVFFVCLGILAMSFPSLQYGRLTDKRAGSDWLMLPASRLEKYLSMLTVSFVILPLIFFFFYNLTDWILSLCDPTYGTALVSFRLNDAIASDGGIVIGGEQVFRFTGNGFWLIWLSFAANISVFLLGALCFRKHKISGTILCEILVSILFSTVVSMLAVSGSFDGIVHYLEKADEWEVMRNIQLKANLLLWIPNLIMTGGLLVAVWFRLKNMKH